VGVSLDPVEGAVGVVRESGRGWDEKRVATQTKYNRAPPQVT